MDTRGFYIYYINNLGIKLLTEVRLMVKNNEFEKWLELFAQLQIIKSCDAEYTENFIDNHAQSFLKSLNSKYIIVEK
jgi:hypothetical protein